MDSIDYCCIPSCWRPKFRARLCKAHYRQWQLNGYDPEKITDLTNAEVKAFEHVCIVPGCGHPQIAIGLCESHKAQYYRRNHGLGLRDEGRDYSVLTPLRHISERMSTANVCAGPECDRVPRVRDLCHAHLQQFYKRGQDYSKLTPLRQRRV